jgi:hypothetical protein
VTWKAHRDAVFYGDTRRYGLASSYVFGRIGTGFGKDKRKMCPGQGRTVPERKAESSGAVRHRGSMALPSGGRR